GAGFCAMGRPRMRGPPRAGKGRMGGIGWVGKGSAARVVAGHATAAPPRRLMKRLMTSRRRMGSSPTDDRDPVAGKAYHVAAGRIGHYRRRGGGSARRLLQSLRLDVEAVHHVLPILPLPAHEPANP